MASVNIWRETVVYDELTINERQKRDPEFGELLNEVRVNCVSDKSVAQLRKAVITCTAIEMFQELLGQGLSPVCLFATKKSCDQFNTTQTCCQKWVQTLHSYPVSLNLMKQQGQ